MKYKVIALSVSGKGKKIFSARQIVDGKEFHSGSISELISGGFIEPYGKAESAKPDNKPSVASEAKTASGNDDDKVEAPSYDDFYVRHINAALADLKVDYDEKVVKGKQPLWNLLLSNGIGEEKVIELLTSIKEAE